MRAGNGYLTITHRRPDKLAFLQAFGEQAQTISIGPQDFNGVTPSAAKDEQVTGDGFSDRQSLFCRTAADLRLGRRSLKRWAPTLPILAEWLHTAVGLRLPTGWVLILYCQAGAGGQEVADKAEVWSKSCPYRALNT